MQVSVSLWSYIHSYLVGGRLAKNGEIKGFPSPYGVIFILTMKLGLYIKTK